MDKQTGKPQKNVLYRLKRKSGEFIEGKSDEDGLTKKMQAHEPEEVEIFLFNRSEAKIAKAVMTPKTDTQPVQVALKVFWETEKEWTASDIATYHQEAHSIAAEIQRTTKHTCDKFALSILVKFASKHKLPIRIKTGSGIFHNIELDNSKLDQYESSQKGYSEWAVPHFAAPDAPSNTLPVAGNSDLLAGDILLKCDKSHVQVVMWANPKEIGIKQGNFPPWGWTEIGGDLTIAKERGVGWTKSKVVGGQNESSAPGSNNDLGVPIEDGIYRYEASGIWSYQNVTLGKPKEYHMLESMVRLRWNFNAFGD